MLRYSSFVALALCIYGAWSTDPKLVAKKYTDSLQEKTHIDWSKPPQIESSVKEPTCARFWFQCFQTRFLLRQTLSKPVSSGQDSAITVDYDSFPQKRFLNINEAPVMLNSEDSTWSTSGTSDSWNGGASFTGKGITISGGYSYSKHDSTTKIGSLGVSESCPPGHECRFETWVYYANYDGQCRHQAVINCARDMDVCPKMVDMAEKNASNSPEELRCSQYFEWSWKQCRDPKGPQYASHPQANCTIRLPIRESSGSPLWTLVFVKEDFRDGVEEDDSNDRFPLFKTTKTGYWKTNHTGEESRKASGACNNWDELLTKKPCDDRCLMPYQGHNPCHVNDDPSTANGSRKAANARLGAGRTFSKRADAVPNIEVKVVRGFQGF
ncbi:hypothetical protein XA68_12977 [Ophiocordyceps unilateralis]|uniref:Uncharacterized protein n=1 Tax=Ophiocordyceps unilateralis TaxID=268505 RepID=A0A2A9PDK4_OPHUN|nr:hypothetical protein XA68_12977 [Ophiocordyceps unilateralis]